jgi:hypothetical protein
LFRRLDERIRYLNQKGIIADLVLAPGPGDLVKAFPNREDQRRFLRYVVGRFGAFNVTWEVVNQLPTPPNERRAGDGRTVSR